MRERRIMLGPTQQQMAELIGVTSQQTHKYEKGSNRVSADRLCKIARALPATSPWEARLWNRLRRRFAIGRICVVADRVMISAETIAELETRELLYLLGIRERTDKVVRDVVLADTVPRRLVVRDPR